MEKEIKLLSKHEEEKKNSKGRELLQTDKCITISFFLFRNFKRIFIGV